MSLLPLIKILTKPYNVLIATIKDLNDEILILKRRLKQKSQECDELSDKYTESRMAIDCFRATRSILEEEIEKLKSRMLDLSSEKDAAVMNASITKTETLDLRVYNKIIETQLRDAEITLDLKVKQLEKAFNEISSLKTTVLSE